jgi:outer membrane protein assembly factor BamB
VDQGLLSTVNSAARWVMIAASIVSVTALWLYLLARLGSNRIRDFSRSCRWVSEQFKTGIKSLRDPDIIVMQAYALWMMAVGVAMILAFMAYDRGLSSQREGFMKSLGEFLSELGFTWMIGVPIVILAALGWGDILGGLKIMGLLALITYLLPPMVMIPVFFAAGILGRLHAWMAETPWVGAKAHWRSTQILGGVGVSLMIASGITLGLSQPPTKTPDEVAVKNTSAPGFFSKLFATATPTPEPSPTPLPIGVPFPGGHDLGADTLWSMKLEGVIEKAPAIGEDGNIIYVITQSGRLYAMNKQGEIAWQEQIAETEYRYGNYTLIAYGSDGRVLVIAEDRLYAFTADGRPLWTVQLDEPLRTLPAFGPDGSMYVMSSESDLSAFSPGGESLWQVSLCTTRAIDSWPSLAVGPDGKVFVACGSEYVYAVEPSAGELVWEKELQYFSPLLFFNSQYVKPFIAPDGTVYIVDNDGEIHALDSAGNSLWTQAIDYRGRVNPDFGWLSAQAILYIGTSRSLYALNLAGDVLWDIPLQSKAWIDEGPAGQIVLSSLKDGLMRISPDGEIDWQMPFPDLVKYLGKPSFSPDGRMYIGMENRLLCVKLP